MASNARIPMVVAIDGPAGAGKSTIAKQVARRLGFTYLDTGAMYRSVTLKALRENINLEDEAALVDLAKGVTIELVVDASQEVKVFLDEEDVSEAIRTPEVTNNTFYIARIPGVREVMVARQREIGSECNIVAEGRDIGTVVFPHAAKKIYLDADFKERSGRRFKELKEKGKKVEQTDIQNDLQERDHKDFTRKVGPLKKAEDAITIDSTHMSINEVVSKVVEIVQQNG